jgi:hypothetical protein
MRWAIDVWSSLGRDFSATASLLCLYIEEAHAQDEWPITSARLSRTGAPVCIKQHVTLEDRLAACRDFVRDYQVPLEHIGVAVDAVQGNPFQTLYAAWPIRWYVFRQGGGRGPVVETIGMPDDGSFNLMEVRDILESMQ